MSTRNNQETKPIFELPSSKIYRQKRVVSAQEFQRDSRESKVLQVRSNAISKTIELDCVTEFEHAKLTKDLARCGRILKTLVDITKDTDNVHLIFEGDFLTEYLPWLTNESLFLYHGSILQLICNISVSEYTHVAHLVKLDVLKFLTQFMMESKNSDFYPTLFDIFSQFCKCDISFRNKIINIGILDFVSEILGGYLKQIDISAVESVIESIINFCWYCTRDPIPAFSCMESIFTHLVSILRRCSKLNQNNIIRFLWRAVYMFKSNTQYFVDHNIIGIACDWMRHEKWKISSQYMDEQLFYAVRICNILSSREQTFTTMLFKHNIIEISIELLGFCTPKIAREVMMILTNMVSGPKGQLDTILKYRETLIPKAKTFVKTGTHNLKSESAMFLISIVTVVDHVTRLALLDSELIDILLDILGFPVDDSVTIACLEMLATVLMTEENMRDTFYMKSPELNCKFCSLGLRKILEEPYFVESDNKTIFSLSDMLLSNVLIDLESNFNQIEFPSIF